MAQIITYPKLSTLANNDLLLVSDVSSVNKTTNSLEVDTLAQHIIITNNVIKGGGTLRSIAMFTPTGAEIGDAIMRQNLGGTEIEVGGSLLVNNSVEVQDDVAVNNNLTVDNQSFLNGVVDMGAALNVGGVAFFASTVEFDDDVTFNNRIADNVGSFGTAGQVLSSTGSGVQWTSDGGGTVTGTGVTNTLPLWSDGPNGVLASSNVSQQPTEIFIDDELVVEGDTYIKPSLRIGQGSFTNIPTQGYLNAFNTLQAFPPTTGSTDTRSGIVSIGRSDNGNFSETMYALELWTPSDFTDPTNYSDAKAFRYRWNDNYTFCTINAEDYPGGNSFPLWSVGDIGGETTTARWEVNVGGYARYRSPGFPVHFEVTPNDAQFNVPVTGTTIIINGLINNLASAATGGYDFMEWVSNVTSATQIPVMKTPRDLVLKAVSYSWMGDTALSIGVGEQVAFTIGTIPSGVNPVIANYTSSVSLFDLTNADDGTYANDVVTGLNQSFSAGDVIAVVGQETGTVTPNTGELSLCFEFVTQ